MIDKPSVLYTAEATASSLGGFGLAGHLDLEALGSLAKRPSTWCAVRTGPHLGATRGNIEVTPIDGGAAIERRAA